MFFLIGFYLSPSNVQGSLSIIENPSCIGIKKSVELSFLQKEKSILFSFYNWGLGINYKKGIKILTSSIFLSNYFFGFGMGKIEDGTIFGTYIRPYEYLRFGMNLKLLDDGSILSDIGLSFYPFISNLLITISSYVKWNTEFGFSFIESYFEPLEGIGLKGIYDFREKKFSGGLTLSLNRLRFSGYGNVKDLNDNNIIYQASFFPYPSFIKESKRSIIYEISGDYPELSEISLLKEGKSFIKLLFELKEIRDSKDIKKIIFLIKRNSLGIAQAEEIRRIIEEISGTKETYGFTDYPSIKNLYLLTGCDSIIIPPSGEINLSGIVVEKTYIKGLLEKIGVEPQFLKIGKYKSAVEVFTMDSMSKFDREQIEAYVNTIIDVVIKGIADARKIDFGNFQKIVDTLGYLTPKEAENLNIVDTVMFLEDLKERTKIKKFYEEKKKKVPIFLPKIAILIIEGDIMQGKSVPKVPIMNEKIVGDETIVKIVEKIKNDKRIKGVIIRINSPGGDAFASLRIWNSLNSLKEKKPVLISFGDISASGGYLISSIGSKILSDKTTLTGSIGIFMGKFSMGGLYKKLGIKKDYVKWGEHADVFSDTRRFDEYELKRIEKILRENYEDFTSRVSKSRGIPVDSVEKLGEGRVWSGRDAKNIGLVDANGGLLDAIEEMKRILNIKGKVGILIYPQNIGIIDIIEKSLNPELRSFDENNLYYYEPLKIYVK